jgi:hypothetical protein
MTEQKTTVEYKSATKGWINIEDMAQEHLVNVIKKSLREQKVVRFRQVNSMEFVLQPDVATEQLNLRLVG